MKPERGTIAILAGAVLLAPPAIFLFAPAVFRVTGYRMADVSIDFRGAVILLVLSIAGSALFTSGIWMLRSRKE